MKTIELGPNGIRLIEHLSRRKKELEAKMEKKVIKLNRSYKINKILDKI